MKLTQSLKGQQKVRSADEKNGKRWFIRKKKTWNDPLCMRECVQVCMVLDFPWIKFWGTTILQGLFHFVYGQKFAMISFVNGFYPLIGPKDGGVGKRRIHGPTSKRIRGP